MVNGGTPSLVDRGEKVVYISFSGRYCFAFRSCIAFIYFIVLYFALITSRIVVFYNCFYRAI